MAASTVPPDYARFIRDVPDFPKPGVMFKDISPLLGDAAAFAAVITDLAEAASTLRVTKVVGIEARGFLFGAPLAIALGVGFVPIRKPGKLPSQVERLDYALEYGTDAVEMHCDGVEAGERVVIVDDVLATGGTAVAASQLLDRVGAAVAGCLFVIELGFLGGRARMATSVTSLITYP